LEPVTTIKWAFCIAARRYLERNDTSYIIDEAEKLAEDILEHFDVIQFLAVKVLIPYIALILNAVELCMNSNIDDFGKAFLFYALTPPDEWDDTDDDE
jgi:hypothetical protein